MIMLAPIIVFGYNRPKHLRATLTHLARAEGAAESDLWIFCDGPKPNDDRSNIEAVHAVAHDPEWRDRFRTVRIKISEANKGLARSIIGGVSAVIEHAGRVIVVEDDVVVSPDFIAFINDCLNFYVSDASVGSVTGFSPFAVAPARYAHDVMAIPRNCSHGWATWADRWRDVNWVEPDAARLWQDSGLRRRFNAAGNDRADRLRRQLAGKIDSWSIRFGLWQTLTGRNTIYPVHNLVRNIGYDDSGVHTRRGQDVNAQALSESRPYRLEFVTQDPALIRQVSRIYSGPWYRRAYRDIKATLTRIFR